MTPCFFMEYGAVAALQCFASRGSGLYDSRICEEEATCHALTKVSSHQRIRSGCLVQGSGATLNPRLGAHCAPQSMASMAF